MTGWHVAYFVFGFTTGFMIGATTYLIALKREQEDNKFLSAQALPVGDQKTPIEGILGRAERPDGGWSHQAPPSIYNRLTPDNIESADWADLIMMRWWWESVGVDDD